MTDLPAPNECDVDLNGITLRVATWGERTVPERAVLLVHGITASSRSWTLLGPALAAAGCHAIAPDLRGRGRSAKPPHGYGIPFHANDLLSLCDALDLPRVALVGHSLGAQIGLYLAALHPHRIAKLALVDAGGKLPPDTYEAIAPALARLGQTYPSIAAYLAAMRAATSLHWNDYAEAYYRYDAEQHPDGTVTSTVPAAAIAEDIAANWATRLDALAEHVKAPTLIVRATVGLLGPDRGRVLSREEADRLHGAIPGSRQVEIPATNHYTVITTERFTQEVASFLDAAP